MANCTTVKRDIYWLTKQLIVLAILGAVSCLFLINTSWAASFKDVGDQHPHSRAIEFLKEKSIVQGYKNKKGGADFKPNNPIIRAEALKMILEAMEIDETVFNTKTVYKDVGKKQWFHDYVMKATELNIVKGYGSGQFKPNKDLSLVEALKILAETAGVNLNQYQQKKPVFNDVKSSDWFAPYVNFAQEKNIIIGLDNGSLDPHRKITRAQLAEIIYRTIMVKNNNSAKYNLTADWPIFVHPRDNYQVNLAPSWTAQDYQDTVVFWRKEEAANTRFFAQLSPASAYVAAFTDINSQQLAAGQYFQQQINEVQKSKAADVKYSQGKLGEISYLKFGYKDQTAKWHFYLPNKKVVIMFVNITDNAVYRDQVAAEGLLATFRNGIGNKSAVSLEKTGIAGPDIATSTTNQNPKPQHNLSNEQIMSQIRENILVEQKGKEMLELIGDELIFETDTIGVGTGPVDYYYSKDLNVTIKYERSVDLILDVKSGKSDKF